MFLMLVPIMFTWNLKECLRFKENTIFYTGFQPLGGKEIKIHAHHTLSQSHYAWGKGLTNDGFSCFTVMAIRD